MQSWTSPGGNTTQDTNCTAICLLSRKLFKLDEPDMQDTAGKQGRTHKRCTLMDLHTWPCEGRTTGTNIHSAAMWRYGMLSWRPTLGDERCGGVAREGQWYPCYQHDDDDDDDDCGMQHCLSNSLLQYFGCLLNEIYVCKYTKYYRADYSLK